MKGQAQVIAVIVVGMLVLTIIGSMTVNSYKSMLRQKLAEFEALSVEYPGCTIGDLVQR